MAEFHLVTCIGGERVENALSIPRPITILILFLLVGGSRRYTRNYYSSTCQLEPYISMNGIALTGKAQPSAAEATAKRAHMAMAKMMEERDILGRVGEKLKASNENCLFFVDEKVICSVVFVKCYWSVRLRKLRYRCMRHHRSLLLARNKL